MADPTFGVKIAPELKEKIDQLFKDSDFSTQKEWFQHMLSIYDLHQLRHQEGIKRYASDLDYIVQNLTRVQETIVQLLKKTADEVVHQEAEWTKASDEIQQQLQQSEQFRKNLESQLIETEEQTNQHKKNLTDLQKQSSIVDELCSTLKKSLHEKEAEIERLNHERTQWLSSDYPSTIQRLVEDNQDLKQQCQMQQHQINLLRMEYEKKLEVEQLKTDFAKKEAELLLLSQRKLRKGDPDDPPRKRGRPRKDEPILSVSGQQQLFTDVYDDTEDEQNQEYDLPDDAKGLYEMLGDEPPQT
ncbi:hypothetical protein [Paenibacillus tianjinensis]|uniref:Uncharacterized protein n=1 Tax=Paenibacillus tianjinensis TaxID=2810347 RepID=A0ABX7LHV5_9BACL|nr:hypothetical protein [Paenibacillus tianjinensis]QSF46529.1 hypothetical protein JRJ22_08135 [Paenibacillus tianjinensis]